MPNAVRCRSWADVDLTVTTQQARIEALETRLRTVEKQIDTLGSPLWKRFWFRVQGWPPWYVVAARPGWRPWRRVRRPP